MADSLDRRQASDEVAIAESSERTITLIVCVKYTLQICKYFVVTKTATKVVTTKPLKSKIQSTFNKWNLQLAPPTLYLTRNIVALSQIRLGFISLEKMTKRIEIAYLIHQ
jgi:hypothetical protein